MAIYHCSTKPLARSSGRSAVAAAAYRSGHCLVDERQGLEHNYTRRCGNWRCASPVGLPRSTAARWTWRYMPQTGKATSATGTPTCWPPPQGNRRRAGREMRDRAVRRQAPFPRPGAGAHRSGVRPADVG